MAEAKLQTTWTTAIQTHVILKMTVPEAKYLLDWIDDHSKVRDDGPVMIALRSALKGA